MKNKQSKDPAKIVLFGLDEGNYALYLDFVVRIIQAVEITPLPKAPVIVSGVINVQGEIIPIIDIRKLFRLPKHEMDPDNQIIIAKTSKRTVALLVDSVQNVSDLENTNVVDAANVFPFADFLAGITVYETNIVLINDLDKFLSLDDELALDEALNGGAF